MINVAPDSIFQVASGFMASKHLFIANEVRLFEKLAAGPATLNQLAERTGIKPSAIRILADSMVSLGFIDRQGDLYQNGPVAATFLSGQTPADLRPFLHFWNRISYPSWTQLEESIRTGQPGVGHLSPELTKIFSEGVEAITDGPALALASSYDFSQNRRLLDLGGGTGSFLLALQSRYPDLELALYEQQEVAAVARQKLGNSPNGDKIRVVEGDFLKDPIPEGYDLVLVANVVHLFSPEHNLELLQRIREKISAGARLLLVDFWTDPTHTQPTFAVLMAGEFLMFTGEGDVYSGDEVRVWLTQTGWQFVEQKPLAGPNSLIVAEAV